MLSSRRPQLSAGATPSPEEAPHPPPSGHSETKLVSRNGPRTPGQEVVDDGPPRWSPIPGHRRSQADSGAVRATRLGRPAAGRGGTPRIRGHLPTDLEEGDQAKGAPAILLPATAPGPIIGCALRTGRRPSSLREQSPIRRRRAWFALLPGLNRAHDHRERAHRQNTNWEAIVAGSGPTPPATRWFHEWSSSGRAVTMVAAPAVG